jgi:hypothetical protein
VSPDAPARPVAPGWPRQAWVVAAFLGAALALFHEVVFGGRQFFYRDLAMQWHPQVEAFVHAVASGSWPVWNPYVSFGQPLLATPTAAVFYPFTWLNLLLPAWTFYTWFAVFHLVVAGCGAYALGRHLGLSRGGALTAGLLWVLSGPFLSLVNLWSHMAGAAWMPWVVRAGDRALHRPSARRTLSWGALLALLVLIGSPESLLMALVAGAFLWARHGRETLREPRRLLPVAAVATIALAVAAALSAAQWLPAVDVARHSRRADLPKEAREFWSVHPWTLAQVTLPVFPDRLPLQAAWRDRWYESREPYLGSLYVGLASLALVFAGVAAGGGRRWVWSLLALAALSILFALGRHAPAYDVLAAVVPPLRTLRYPVKAMVLASFCIAMIGGHGFDAWRERKGSDRRWTLLALGLLMLAAAALVAGVSLAVDAERWGSALLIPRPQGHAQVLAPVSRSLLVCGTLAALAALSALLTRFRWRTQALAAAVAAAAVADLAEAQRGLNPTAPAGALSVTPPVLAVARPAPYQRTFVFDYARGRSAERLLGHAGFVPVLPRDQQDPWHGVLALRLYAHPALLGLWQREGSYGVDFMKLHSHDVNTVNALVEMNESSPGPTHRLLRIGAVDTVVAMHRQGFEELRLVTALPSLFSDPILVYRVPDPLPRAYVVGRARVAPPGQGWRALLDQGFDPGLEVVLPQGPVLDTGATGSVRIVEFRPDRVTLDADLDAPGYVVLVDAYDAGWKASVDGRPARLLRANVAFRAVEAAAGRHVIRFVYRPASVTAGIAISALAVLAAGGLWIAGRRRPRAREAGSSSPAVA